MRCTYAKLCYADDTRVSLGRYDEFGAAPLLECVLRAVHKLSLYELQALLRADKSMREARPRRGRPRKKARK